VVKHRDFRAPSGFLASQGRRWCCKVKVVVTDGSQSYRAAIERHLGHATLVVDHFHVVRWFAQGSSRCAGGSSASDLRASRLSSRR
jgi:transposase